MAVRYFCDRCGTETGSDELRQAEFSLPPDPDIALDLCPRCATEVRKQLVGDGGERGFAAETAATGG
jgi:hypothetical protein